MSFRTFRKRRGKKKRNYKFIYIYLYIKHLDTFGTAVFLGMGL